MKALGAALQKHSFLVAYLIIKLVSCQALTIQNTQPLQKQNLYKKFVTFVQHRHLPLCQRTVLRTNSRLTIALITLFKFQFPLLSKC